MHLKTLVGFLAFLSLVVVVSIMVFRYWRGPSKARTGTINFLLMVYTLAYLFLGLEVYFFLFAVQPEGFSVTLASKRWFALNYRWNTLGYRDDEQTPKEFEGKRTLFVVGDSFAAGSGVPNRADRFSDQLAQRMGNGWRVANLATGGWDTVRELAALKRYPVKPDVVILSYYLNDINHAVESKGLESNPSLPKPPAFLKYLVEYSYFVNSVYWRVFRFQLKFVTADYWSGLKKYYAMDDIWNEHARALGDFARYCKESKITLYTLIFPNLTAVEESEPFTQKVADYLEGLGVPVLDLAPILMGRKVVSMVVNAGNAHPNEVIHHEVGALLHDFLRKHGEL